MYECMLRQREAWSSAYSQERAKLKQKPPVSRTSWLAIDTFNECYQNKYFRIFAGRRVYPVRALEPGAGRVVSSSGQLEASSAINRTCSGPAG